MEVVIEGGKCLASNKSIVTVVSNKGDASTDEMLISQPPKQQKRI